MGAVTKEQTLVRIADALERIAASMETDAEVLDRMADGLEGVKLAGWPDPDPPHDG